MSTPPGSGEKSRNWNLGKATKPAPPPPTDESTLMEARPGRLAPAAPRPVAPAAPPPPAEEPYLPPRERAIQQAMAERPPLGRAIVEGDLKPARQSLLTHPVTLAVVAVGFTCSLLYLFFSGALTGHTVKTMKPPTQAERVASFYAVLATQDLAVDAPPPAPPNDIARGWVLMAASQMMAEVATFLEGPGDSKPTQFQSTPPVIKLVILPPADTTEYFRAKMRWEERALGSIAVGQEMVTMARTAAIRPADLRRVATQLALAGMARLDKGLTGAARGDFPGIEGAAERWKATRPTNALDGPDVEVLRAVAPPPFLAMIEASLAGA